MSSLTSNTLFRLFSPKLLPPNTTKSKLLSSYKSTLSNPISFQTLTLTKTNTSPPSHPIKSQSQTLTQNLPQNLQTIITLFQSVPDNKLKYRQLLDYGTRLPPFPPEFRNDSHRVRGCVSQVWVHAYPDPADPSKVRFDADSDSQLTKGLAALLVLGLSGEPPAIIAAVPPDFVHLLGLNQSLTPSRNNGFLNMLKTMQQEALRIAHGGDPQVPVSDLREEDGDVTSSVEEDETEEVEVEEEEEVEEEKGVSGGREVRIRERLEKALSPTELEVEDISHLHAGHAGVRGMSNGETHFNVRVVSEEFRDKSMVKRHRLVYDILREELESGLHALSIVAKTPSENR